MTTTAKLSTVPRHCNFLSAFPAPPACPSVCGFCVNCPSLHKSQFSDSLRGEDSTDIRLSSKGHAVSFFRKYVRSDGWWNGETKEDNRNFCYNYTFCLFTSRLFLPLCFLSLCLCLCLCFCVHVCLYLSICLSVCLSCCLSVSPLSLSLSLSLSRSLSLPLSSYHHGERLNQLALGLLSRFVTLPGDSHGQRSCCNRHISSI